MDDKIKKKYIIFIIESFFHLSRLCEFLQLDSYLNATPYSTNYHFYIIVHSNLTASTSSWLVGQLRPLSQVSFLG